MVNSELSHPSSCNPNEMRLDNDLQIIQDQRTIDLTQKLLKPKTSVAKIKKAVSVKPSKQVYGAENQRDLKVILTKIACEKLQSKEYPHWIQNQLLKLSTITPNDDAVSDKDLMEDPDIVTKTDIDLIDWIEKLLHFPVSPEKLTTDLVEIFSFVDQSCTELFFSQITTFTYRMETTLELMKNLNYLEIISVFLIGFYVKMTPQPILKNVLPLFKFIKTPKLIRQSLHLFQSSDSLHTLFVILKELTRIDTLLFSNPLSSLTQLDESILNHALECGLLKEPQNVIFKETYYKQKLILNLLYYSNHKKSCHYLEWVIKNVKWVLYYDWIDFLMTPNAMNTEHFLYNRLGSCHPKKMNAKLRIILPHLKHLNLSIRVKGKSKRSYVSLVENGKLISYENWKNAPTVMCNILDSPLSKKTLDFIKYQNIPISRDDYLRFMDKYISINYIKNGDYLFNLTREELLDTLDIYDLLQNMEVEDGLYIDDAIDMLLYLKNKDPIFLKMIQEQNPIQILVEMIEMYDKSDLDQIGLMDIRIKMFIKNGIMMTLNDFLKYHQALGNSHSKKLLSYIISKHQHILFKQIPELNDIKPHLRKYLSKGSQVGEIVDNGLVYKLIDNETYDKDKIFSDVVEGDQFIIMSGFFINHGFLYAIKRWSQFNKSDYLFSKKWLKFSKWIDWQKQKYELPNMKFRDLEFTKKQAKSSLRIRIVSNNQVEVINNNALGKNDLYAGSKEEVYEKVSKRIKDAKNRTRKIASLLKKLKKELSEYEPNVADRLCYDPFLESLEFKTETLSDDPFPQCTTTMRIPDCTYDQLKEIFSQIKLRILQRIKFRKFLRNELFILNEENAYTYPIFSKQSSFQTFFNEVKKKLLLGDINVGITPNYSALYYEHQKQHYLLISRSKPEFVTHYRFLKEIAPNLHRIIPDKEILKEICSEIKIDIHDCEADIDVKKVLLEKFDDLIKEPNESRKALKKAIKKIYNYDLLGWDTISERGQNYYKMIKIRLSQICKRYLDTNDNDGFRLLITTEIDNAGYCGTRRGESIWQQYRLCFQDVLPNPIPNQKITFNNLVKDALLEMIFLISTRFKSVFATNHPSHLRNYIRKVMMELGYTPPQDPNIPPELSGESDDVFASNHHFSEISEDTLKVAIENMITPQIIIYFCKQLDKYHNYLLNPTNAAKSDISEANGVMSDLLLLFKQSFLDANKNIQYRLLRLTLKKEEAFKMLSKLSTLLEERKSYLNTEISVRKRLSLARKSYDKSLQKKQKISQIKTEISNQLDLIQQNKHAQESLIDLLTSSSGEDQSKKVQLAQNCQAACSLDVSYQATQSHLELMRKHPKLEKLDRLNEALKKEELLFERIHKKTLPTTEEIKWENFFIEAGFFSPLGDLENEFITFTNKGIIALLYLHLNHLGGL